MKTTKLFIKFIILIGLLSPFFCQAMSPGTILYRTSGQGKMYGYSDDPLIYAEKGIIKNIYSGHVGIYIGQENGEDYIIEALADGIVKTPAKYFINLAQGEEFVGAKIPKKLSAIQRAKVIEIAKSLVGKKLGYDFDFKKQKGPNDGDWTCVGLVEKIYESANISNPYNLGALEYDKKYYAIDITPDGFDNYSKVNSEGDCFSSDYEFSKIARRTNLLIPAPELIGFDAGREYNGERYIFIPYTQFLQPNLKDVDVDIQISSDFLEEEIRGKTSISGLVLRWSLINNPISSIKRIANGVKNMALGLKEAIFGSTRETDLVIIPQDVEQTNSSIVKSSTVAKKTTEVKRTEPLVKVNKRVITNQETQLINSSEEKDQSAAVITSNIIFPDSVISEKTKETTQNTNFNSLYPKPAIQSNTTTLLNKLNSSTTSLIVAASSTNVQNNTNNFISSNTSTVSSGSSTSVNGGSPTVEPVEDWPKLAIINQVYATGYNDWIELYNPTDHDFDLAEAGYRLEKAKTGEDPSLLIRIGNTDDGVYPGGTIIKAESSYLIVRDEANDYYRSQADAISNRDEFSWLSSGYTLYLGVGAISSSIDPDIIDALGFGPDATYFQGEGPASEINDNYILRRLANSGNNNSDFSLVLSDDPSIEIIATSTTATSSDESIFPAATTNSYLPFTPINSLGITHLWHFNECHGLGTYSVGKWDCAREISFNTESIIIDLDPLINSNNFSLGFYYRKTNDSPLVDFKLQNEAGKTIRLSLENGRAQIEGLPNSQWRYYNDYFFSDGWHQIILVINKDSGYWALYLDGQEEIREEFIESLPSNLNHLEISSDRQASLVDELVFWSRSLEPQEINSNYQLNVPFAPINPRSEPQIAQLKHFWNFNEGNDLIDEIDNLQAFDSVASSTITLWPDSWTWRKNDNSALKINWEKDLKIDFNQLTSKDLALTFWWRNSVHPNEGRIKVSLKYNDHEMLGLVPTYYRPGFYFNHNEGIFSQALNETIPKDDLWHHLALSYDSYQYLLHFYVDGEEKKALPYIWISDEENINQLEIKSELASSEIDDLGVWTGIMTADKIKEIYSNSK